MTTSATVPADAPPPLACLLTDAAGVGRLVGLSARSVRRMSSAGRLPRPVRCGGAVRWRVREIEAWVEAGCPDRKAWESAQRP
jgi:predicted DNA-binding transcriptional regulator AlpA